MDEKALEAAKAVLFREAGTILVGGQDFLDYDDDAFRAAITAYLEASGEARDAARYRCFRKTFGIAVPDDDGSVIWHENEIDAVIDTALEGK